MNKEERKAYDRARYEANREARIEATRQWQRGNEERFKAYREQYYQRNREKLIENSKQQWKAKKAARGSIPSKPQLTAEQKKIRRKELRRIRYLANREEELERQRAYDKANREQHEIRVRKRRALKQKAEGSHSFDDVWQMYEDQQGLCAYCETPLFGNYHVDHMVPLSKGGGNGWNNLALTCPFCNTSKGAKTAEEYMAY